MGEIISSATTMLFWIPLIGVLLSFAGAILVWHLKLKMAERVFSRSQVPLSTLIPELIDLVKVILVNKDQFKPTSAGTTATKSGRLKVTITPKRIISNGEEYLYSTITKLIERAGIEAYVFCQVSYTGILDCTGQDTSTALQAFHGKRAPILVTDYDYLPVAVVEYHGLGHLDQDDTRRAEQLKKRLCGAAGIPYFTFNYNDKHRLENLIKETLMPVLPNDSEVITACRSER